MKTLALILVVIALCLGSVSWNLVRIARTLDAAEEQAQLIIASHQSLISANARLEQELVSLRKQVESVKDSFPRR